jgi:transcriptional regulator with GAF, ATPase, and Fis domain
MLMPSTTDLGRQITSLSLQAWGKQGVLHLIGRSEGLLEAQQKLARFARVDRPVLITGESGVGKEMFAKAVYLLSPRLGKPFLGVNCAQYQNEELLVSELFGHRKGTFTGAHEDRRGLFEEANGGVVFLDEVGELSLHAQAMLLRVLSEGEIKPLGETRVRHVDVRVIAATNRPLKEMVAEKTFREDLFYRLRYLQVDIPPLRERQDDWRLIIEFFLDQMNLRHAEHKKLSPEAVAVLGAYRWPGNVREARSIADIGFCLAEGELIQPADFAEHLEPENGSDAQHPSSTVVDYYTYMLEHGQSFWHVVREPFLDRELNREQVKAIIDRGLSDSNGSYKRLLELFQIQQDDYLKFMDFLRHHRLKPESRRRLAQSVYREPPQERRF